MSSTLDKIADNQVEYSRRVETLGECKSHAVVVVAEEVGQDLGLNQKGTEWKAT